MNECTDKINDDLQATNLMLLVRLVIAMYVWPYGVLVLFLCFFLIGSGSLCLYSWCHMFKSLASQLNRLHNYICDSLKLPLF